MHYRKNWSQRRREIAGARSGLRCAAVDRTRRAVMDLETAEGPQDECAEVLSAVFDLLAGRQRHAEGCECHPCNLVHRIFREIGAFPAAEPEPEGEDVDDPEDSAGLTWPELPVCRRRWSKVVGYN